MVISNVQRFYESSLQGAMPLQPNRSRVSFLGQAVAPSLTTPKVVSSALTTPSLNVWQRLEDGLWSLLHKPHRYGPYLKAYYEAKRTFFRTYNGLQDLPTEGFEQAFKNPTGEKSRVYEAFFNNVLFNRARQIPAGQSGEVNSQYQSIRTHSAEEVWTRAVGMALTALHRADEAKETTAMALERRQSAYKASAWLGLNRAFVDQGLVLTSPYTRDLYFYRDEKYTTVSSWSLSLLASIVAQDMGVSVNEVLHAVTATKPFEVLNL